MADEKFQRAVKKHIPHRDWQSISGRWLEFLPLMESPKTPPDPVLEDFHLLRTALESDAASDFFLEEIEGLRQLVFQEGLFLFHKAVNVISAAETHAQQGMLTWSLSSAYHGAFFGVKAINRFLGVATVAQGRNHWIIDLYPKLPRLSSRERKQGREPPSETAFILTHTRIEHRHIWYLFQRLMRVCEFQDHILTNLKGALSRHFQEDAFAKQRNALHYRNDAWFFDDLYQLVKNPEFGTASILLMERIPFDSDRLESDFSMILAFVVLYFGISLLESLSEKTHKLDGELDLIRESITPAWHPIYIANLEAGSRSDSIQVV